ncbi:hypothetical protein MRB53_014491 [Persea americana]|uniref:Uncharacterized protein n=1 Tax=Persea americana TaxID=3435 RepID=A0ACC2KB29_PERAE|nr:hypothetical protein MRB53_014491 [Persea americana]
MVLVVIGEEDDGTKGFPGVLIYGYGLKMFVAGVNHILFNQMKIVIHDVDSTVQRDRDMLFFLFWKPHSLSIPLHVLVSDSNPLSCSAGVWCTQMR